MGQREEGRAELGSAAIEGKSAGRREGAIGAEGRSGGINPNVAGGFGEYSKLCPTDLLSVSYSPKAKALAEDEGEEREGRLGCFDDFPRTRLKKRHSAQRPYPAGHRKEIPRLSAIFCDRFGHLRAVPK
ncbi:hypothetical protein KM043_001346 [Ampulex compressa]|nr:hypothetical protein KM043_001346 [Ampulex compressa]